MGSAFVSAVRLCHLAGVGTLCLPDPGKEAGKLSPPGPTRTTTSGRQSKYERGKGCSLTAVTPGIIGAGTVVLACTRPLCD